MRTYPWGPKQVLIGAGAGIAAYAVALLGIVLVLALIGHENGTDDPVNARATYLLGLGLYVLLGAAVLFGTRQSIHALWRIFAFRKFDVMVEWLPMGVAVLAYLGVIAYAIGITALGLDFLKPEGNTIGEGVKTDDIALVLFGLVAVVGAPFAEELFFRGLIFSGLLRWGFWPAALISAVFFSLAHASVGSFLPFAAVGVVLAALYYWRGSLIDSMIAHATFNSISFVIFAVTR